MGRILAIDFVMSEVGIATTDPLGIVATPLKALFTHHIFDFLSQYFKKEEVEKVVVGWPKNIDGSDTNNTPLVRAFLNRFKKTISENATVFARRVEHFKFRQDSANSKWSQKKKRRRDKLAIDQISAVLILQSYLESKI